MKFIWLALATFSIVKCTDIKCSQGEVLDINNICIEPKFIQGCHQYQSSITCSKCQYKYKLNKFGICDYQKETTQPCCLEKSNGRCLACNVGLMLDQNGSCKENKIIGCLQKSQKGSCLNCASDYYLMDGKCLPGIKQCNKYQDNKKRNSKQICLSCKKNFSLVNNVCLKNKILGCEYQANHKCHKCLDPFKKKGDSCEISNCLTYNDFGCTACDCGYYLTPQNTCSQVQPGCIRYQRGICSDCQTHFKLRGGSCIMEGCQELDFLICKKCSDGYDLVDGGCRLKNCSVWDNGICFVCNLGFVTQQGGCIKDSRIESIKTI